MNTQNPTMGVHVIINNDLTLTEPSPKNGQHPRPLGGLNAFYWYQIFALDSAIVETHKMLSSYGGLNLTISKYHHGVNN